jgi:hypothetical protein
MLIVVFWVVTSCTLVGDSVTPEDRSRHLHHCENLRYNLTDVVYLWKHLSRYTVLKM